MMEKIANAQIQLLSETLGQVLRPTPEDIHRAMALAYEVGKNDGAAETAQRWAESLAAVRA